MGVLPSRIRIRRRQNHRRPDRSRATRWPIRWSQSAWRRVDGVASAFARANLIELPLQLLNPLDVLGQPRFEFGKLFFPDDPLAGEDVHRVLAIDQLSLQGIDRVLGPGELNFPRRKLLADVAQLGLQHFDLRVRLGASFGLLESARPPHLTARRRPACTGFSECLLDLSLQVAHPRDELVVVVPLAAQQRPARGDSGGGRSTSRSAVRPRPRRPPW